MSGGVTFKRRLVTWCAVVGVLMGAYAVPARATVAPAPSVDAIWLPYWDMPNAVKTVTGSDTFEIASPFWYSADSCTDISGYSGAGDRSVIRSLRGAGVRILPTITGGGLPARAAINCFGDPARLRAHVRGLVDLAQSRAAYAGLDVDYENVAYVSSRTQARRMRAAFTEFTRVLCNALHRNDLACHITVMARTSGSAPTADARGLVQWVFDYAAIAEHADVVRIMAYDQHAGGSGPGPIAGYPWVQAVLDFSLSQIPANQLMLGIPLYARSFTATDSSSMTTREAYAFARRRDRPVRWDSEQREAYFTYRHQDHRHTVYISNARAVHARQLLAERRGILGTAYWAAGQEQRSTFAN